MNLVFLVIESHRRTVRLGRLPGYHKQLGGSLCQSTRIKIICNSDHIALGSGTVQDRKPRKSLFVRTFTAPSTLDELNYEEDIEGAYVRTTVYGIYGSYSETVSSKTKAVKSREYVIDAGEYHYIALRLRSKDLEKAEALMDASFDYLDGKIEADALEPYQFEVTGTVKAAGKNLKYYHDFFDWDELDDESKETVITPYRLTGGDVAGMDTGTMWMFLGNRRRSRRIRTVHPDCQPDLLRKKPSAFFLKSNEGASEEKGPRVPGRHPGGAQRPGGPELPVLLAGGSRFYMDIPGPRGLDVQTVTTHRRNGIPTGKTYGVLIDFIGHKQFEISVKNEQAADELVRTLSQYCGKRHRRLLKRPGQAVPEEL